MKSSKFSQNLKRNSSQTSQFSNGYRVKQYQKNNNIFYQLVLIFIDKISDKAEDVFKKICSAGFKGGENSETIENEKANSKDDLEPNQYFNLNPKDFVGVFDGFSEVDNVQVSASFISKKELRSLDEEAQWLIYYLENNCDSLLNARQQKKRGHIYQLINRFSPLIFADPKNFHGDAFVDKNLKIRSEVTAGLVSGANLFNCITNAPILYYAFNNFGNIPAIIISLVLNSILLNWTNHCGTAAACNKPGNKHWSNAAALGFLIMGLLQSTISGIGIELLNNRPALRQILAEEIIDEQTEKIRELKLQVDSSLSEQAREDCNAKEEELNKLSSNNPRFHSLYTRIYGEWKDRNRDWSKVDIENLPVCIKAERLEKEAHSPAEKANQEWIEKLEDRAKIGNDLEFINRHIYEAYKQYFTNDDEFKSGVEAVRLSFENFFGKLTNLEFYNLGLSLVLCLFSLLTSIVACCMTIQHAQSEDTKMSRNPEVKAAIQDWLEDIQRDYIRQYYNSVCKQDQTDSTYLLTKSNYLNKDEYKEQWAYGKKLIALFRQNYEESGCCDYSSLQEIARGVHRKSWLLPKVAQRNLLALEQAIADIEKSVSVINENLTSLEEYLNNPDIDKRKNTENCQKLIQKNTLWISRRMSLILLISQTYADTAVQPFIHEIKDNFNQYLNEHTRLYRISAMQNNGITDINYIHRLSECLVGLHYRITFLADSIQQSIHSKVPGLKFVPPTWGDENGEVDS